MATLVFSAVGTALGGPLGGALGALVGNQLDRAIIGSRKREGPRLKELAVTTSSYGTPLARHYGRMRAPGSVIWATELKESQEKSGGSKGSPSITTYSYSVSFAVALASRPIRGIGRIWADGNILRGAAGDLKVGGALRIYSGHGDQERDPLVASDRGAACPAFRGIAYCVFENLQLADYGNRIPSLTFEIIADNGAVSLARLVDGMPIPIEAWRPLSELIGFTDEGGALAGSLALIDQLYPLVCDGSREPVRILAGDEIPADPPSLPAPVVEMNGDGFGEQSGRLSHRQNQQDEVPDGLRYYEVERDYQAGLQRAEGRARPGRNRVFEFPGALQATKARQLCNAIVQRVRRSDEQLMWRIAEVDPAISPGSVVRAPGYPGLWRVQGWEWRTSGVELELHRLPPRPAKISNTDAGVVLPPKDVAASPTILVAFELPWDGSGAEADRQVYAAATSTTDGWTGAALYADVAGSLSFLQPTGNRRSVVGSLVTPLGRSSAILVERQQSAEVQLVSEQLAFSSATLEGLAEGRNRLLVGDELIQFATAVPLGSGRWRLEGLLRGRGGTEGAALGHEAGTTIVLLDDVPLRLAPSNGLLEATQTIAAIGLADSAPVLAPIANDGLSRRPLPPVHPQATAMLDGGWLLSWTRRARGAWIWPESGQQPLVEYAESYVVGVGDPESPLVRWQSAEPQLLVTPDVVASLQAAHPGEPIWVSQVGSHGVSDPVLIRLLS